MNRTLRSTVTLAAAAVTIAAATGCAKRKGGPPPRPPVAVQTAEARVLDVPVLVNAFGNTKDRASVDLVPQVSGTLVRTLVADGAVVTNGQPMFQIDPRDYEARVRQAEGIVAADRANLALTRLTLDRNQALRAKELISQEDFDTLATRAEAAAAQLQMDEAGLDQARLNLSRCVIAAPMAGLCSRRYVDDGNLVAAGITRLTNLRSYDPIYVDVSVSETYLPALRAAFLAGPVPLLVHARGATNSYEGVLDSLDNAVDPSTGTIALRGQVPNPALRLWAQQFVDVEVHAGIVRGAVMVPEGAVQFGKQGTYLFAVSKDNKAELRPVRTGVRYHDMIQVMEGVAGGERVVVLGQLMLYPGAAVMDLTQGPPGGGKPPASTGPNAATERRDDKPRKE